MLLEKEDCNVQKKIDKKNWTFHSRIIMNIYTSNVWWIDGN